jgi:2-methylisocitrate lyase-like PEP mutase family enzyme
VIAPMLTQAEKGRAFRALHEHDGAFIIPNPWDVGTARLLAHLAFDALATTSGRICVFRRATGRPIGRDEIMEHVAVLVSATDLPVSADLENCFGDAPEILAETCAATAKKVAGRGDSLRPAAEHSGMQ